MTQVRVAVLCCDGIYQRHLARRIAAKFDLAGIVLQKSTGAPATLLDRLSQYRNPAKLLRHVESRLLLPHFERRGESLKRQLFYVDGTAPGIPKDVPLLETANINTAEVAEFVRRQSPDLVVVNGTQLLRAPLLALIPHIRFGIINLHTGLSPYSRGGNCNLYMLLESHPELVGVTVHHIDAGIDSGDIVLSAQVPMEPGDCYEMIDARSFHLGIELLIAAIGQLAAGLAAGVPQWEQGKLFLRRTGYVYEPSQRLAVNRLLERGLIRDYLAEKKVRDAGVRLVGGVAP
jgi:methionyl-tRNA formyltransferase